MGTKKVTTYTPASVIKAIEEYNKILGNETLLEGIGYNYTNDIREDILDLNERIVALLKKSDSIIKSLNNVEE